jgi:hypothetical protein
MMKFQSLLHSRISAGQFLNARTPSPSFAPPKKNEAIRELEQMSNISDMVPSVLPTALWTKESSDFAMIDSLDFETPIMSIQLRYGPPISTRGTSTPSPARIVPETSLEMINQNYLTTNSDLVVLAIIPSDMAPIERRGHIDAGALASTTHLESSLHDLQLYDNSNPCPIRLVTADNERFAPKGAGYLHVPTGEQFRDYH